MKCSRRINSHESSFPRALKRRGSQTSRTLLVDFSFLVDRQNSVLPLFLTTIYILDRSIDRKSGRCKEHQIIRLGLLGYFPSFQHGNDNGGQMNRPLFSGLGWPLLPASDRSTKMDTFAVVSYMLPPQSSRFPNATAHPQQKGHLVQIVGIVSTAFKPIENKLYLFDGEGFGALLF
jgi:hypothetical protein